MNSEQAYITSCHSVFCPTSACGNVAPGWTVPPKKCSNKSDRHRKQRLHPKSSAHAVEEDEVTPANTAGTAATPANTTAATPTATAATPANPTATVPPANATATIPPAGGTGTVTPAPATAGAGTVLSANRTMLKTLGYDVVAGVDYIPGPTKSLMVVV